MAVIEEKRVITITNKVNYICPICGKQVNPKDIDSMMIKPKGSKVTQWKHISCVRFSNGSRLQ